MGQHCSVQVYGNHDKKLYFDSKVPTRETVLFVKRSIEEKYSISTNRQHFYFGLSELQNDTTLWDIAGYFHMVITAPWEFRLIVDELEPKLVELVKLVKPLEPIIADDIPNIKKCVFDIPTLVKEVNEQRNVISCLRSAGRIQEDNSDTSTMVLSAKKGKWKEVEAILCKKAYIINAIPQERAWSALHQAAYQDNCEAINMLLKIETCDKKIRAKRDLQEQGTEGMTPYELAKKHKRQYQNLLEPSNTEHTDLGITHLSSCKGQNFLENSLTYLDLAVSFLKKDVIKKEEFQDCGLAFMTQKTYDLLERDWQYVQGTVVECLYPFDKMVADRLKDTKSKCSFKKEMIWIYTCNRVYRQVNAALRRASNTEFPHGDDLLLSLYSLFLLSILFHWEDLSKITNTTYRGLYLPHNQAKLYEQGSTFYWLPFTSSSQRLKQAEGFAIQPSQDSIPVIFEIDNTKKSIWSPRDIVPYSVNGPGFLEVVHPCCAKFKVTGISKMLAYTKINIELLGPED